MAEAIPQHSTKTVQRGVLFLQNFVKIRLHLALPRVVIVHDTASEEHAAKGGDILRSNDYEVETRHSENASTGVTVLYRDEIHLGAAQELANLLRAQFPEITVSHNDSVLASYAEFDILVDIGQDEP